MILRCHGTLSSAHRTTLAGATKLAPFAARAFAGGFRMDTCSEFWFSPFPDFDHKRELRSINLTHYSLLRTAR